MYRAKFYEKLKNDVLRCRLCPRYCIINDGKKGNCGVRINRKGVLYSTVYGRAVACNLDPIEKKPLYHFAPGSSTFSIATVGCNLHCMFCQNWELSQAKEITSDAISPKEIIAMAKKSGVGGIAYTYTEPTVFYEYAYDTAKLAKKAGLYNVLVTNGYINSAPLAEIAPLIDAANVDIKAFSDTMYRRYCGISSMKPILSAVEQMVGSGIHVELTNLVVPQMNDDPNEIRKLCGWVYSINPDTPLHFSRYHPEYLLKIPPTPISTLIKAHDIAKGAGLNYVYIGNLADEKYNTTYCPSCGEKVIVRTGLSVSSIHIKNGKCIACGAKIRVKQSV